MENVGNMFKSAVAAVFDSGRISFSWQLPTYYGN